MVGPWKATWVPWCMAVWVHACLLAQTVSVSEDKAVTSDVSHGTRGCSVTLYTLSGEQSKRLEITASSTIGSIFI